MLGCLEYGVLNTSVVSLLQLQVHRACARWFTVINDLDQTSALASHISWMRWLRKVPGVNFVSIADEAQ